MSDEAEYEKEQLDLPERKEWLPRSLDDRKVPILGSSTQVYDPWGGRPVDLEPTATVSIRHQPEKLENELAIIGNNALSEDEKSELLQKIFTTAASNNDQDKVDDLLGSVEARRYIDINRPDEEGSAALIYACCFGHLQMAAKLLDGGADANTQDKHAWSALMWAMNNSHNNIAKLLLERGASTTARSSTGRTALDFVAQDSELSTYMNEEGQIGSAGMGGDFYDQGFAEDRFEDQFAENELKRRMMMESAMNVEVDLSSLGLDEQASEQVSDNEYDQPSFVWDKRLPDQMFTFAENDLDRILDAAITTMQPRRSPSQKPIPANVIFLSARYASGLGNGVLLPALFEKSLQRIKRVVTANGEDMPFLAFWISNAILLLYYVKKDTTLVDKSVEFQLQLVELINDIYVSFVADSIRRMSKVLDKAMLQQETIPGLENIAFKSEWRLFKSKRKSWEPLDSQIRPPSPRQRAKISPRNITSLLSSTLFVLDLYDIHPVIIYQVISQLFYWLGCELFNRILKQRTYLARTRAMQIRLNVSSLEDWAKNNSRSAGRIDRGSFMPTGETTMDAARKYLAPVTQLLQWLQCFSSIGNDIESLQSTIDQLPLLTPKQLLHASANYRAEVGEKGLTSDVKKYLRKLVAAKDEKKSAKPIISPPPSPNPASSSPGKSTEKSKSSEIPSSKEKPESTENLQPTDSATTAAATSPSGPSEESPGPQMKPASPSIVEPETSHEYVGDTLYLDDTLMLPFVLPTATEMVESYGSGIGGVNRERERKYRPMIPSEFTTRLESTTAPSMPTKAHLWETRAEEDESSTW